ncbi:MFS transporter [Nocardioides sp.]|uniref:MFS transporter n=1 Tax=Nocardioides sp. TaxID=35761 RepID=UPI0037852614
MTTSTAPRPTRTVPTAVNPAGDPAGDPGGGRRRTAALALLVSAQFVVMLDTSIVNVALPSIRADLGLGLSALSWVVNAYVLAFGGLLLLLGRVGDLVGRRRMFVAGSAMFTAGTVAAALAPGPWTLLVGRAVQGAGAAALSPAAMSLLVLTFPGARRARAMSLWGAASAVGGATGVLSGGLLVGAFGWSSVFVVTVPVTLTAMLVARHVLDESPRAPRRPFDVVGAVSVTGAVVALVHGALAATAAGWSSPECLLAFATAGTLLVAFVAVERRASDPLVPLGLFRSRLLGTGVVLALTGGATRASTFVLVALYLQQAVGMSPQHAGLAMVPTSATGFVVSLTLLPRVLRAVGPHWSLVAGLVVLAVGQTWLAWAPHDLGYALSVLPGLLLVATGVALSFTPTTMVLTAAAPESHTGLASGLASTATQVGAAVGTATFTAMALTAGPAGSGFTAAFSAAAVVAVATAALGAVAARSGR